MRYHEGLVQLKSGEAVSGAVKVVPFSQYVRVRSATITQPGMREPARADGTLLVPKVNVLFIQRVVRVAAAAAA